MALESTIAARIGVVDVHPMSGGHQSRVFGARLASGDRVVVKVIDQRDVDLVVVRTRAELAAELAESDHCVCRPLPVEGDLVLELSDDDGSPLAATCWEFADGVPLDPDRGDDARSMGRTLAGLHLSMSRLGRYDLPLVAALAATGHVPDGPVQLVHGDFGVANLRRTSGGVRVFDFDDCGYAPAAFDVANAWYMARFDAFMGRSPIDPVEFGRRFADGYSDGSGETFDLDEAERFVELRLAALGRWIEDPDTAPTGIRRATPAWRAVLAGFVRSQRAT
jgi:Ser/Thr protein kinase RdoA (MazF antagonist)